MRNFKKFLMAIPVGIPSLVAVAVIVYLSLSSDPLGTADLPLFPGADKIAHILMYFCATVVFLLDYAKHRLPHHVRTSPELAIVVGAALLGVLMEVCQLMYTNARSYSEGDMLANGVGAFAAMGFMHFYGFHHFRKEFYYKLRRHRHKHRHKHNHSEDQEAVTGESYHTTNP